VIVDPALWPPHGQQAGQDVDENPADPRRHPVSLWGSEVDVEHHYRHADTVHGL